MSRDNAFAVLTPNAIRVAILTVAIAFIGALFTLFLLPLAQLILIERGMLDWGVNGTTWLLFQTVAVLGLGIVIVFGGYFVYSRFAVSSGSTGRM